jgi:hypothetical protein
VVGNSQGTTSTTSGNLGIKTNHLNTQKNTLGEEKNKGKEPQRQKIEEAGALMVDSRQVVYLSDYYFPSQQNC